MSYIPTEWQTGDIVTAEKLNKLEEGVAASGGGGGGGFLVTGTYDAVLSAVTLDKTYNEIKTAVLSGIYPLLPSVIEDNGSTDYIILHFHSMSESNEGYQVVFYTPDATPDFMTFTADSADGTLSSFIQQ